MPGGDTVPVPGLSLLGRGLRGHVGFSNRQLHGEIQRGDLWIEGVSLLGNDGMHSRWLHCQCSLRSLLRSTSECHLGHRSHADSRANSRAHVQVRFVFGVIDVSAEISR